MKKFNYCQPKLLPDLKAETTSKGRFYLTPDGKKMPSITTVLGALKKESIQKWRDSVGHDVANAISNKASTRGTNVHTLCERYLNNAPLGDIMPDAKEMFLSIKPYLNRIDNIRYQEQALWSEKLGVAGRVDCIASFELDLSVIDFKTSKRIKHIDEIQDYFWQTAAYALMYEELVGEPIDNLVIIMAVENSDPIIYKQKTEDYIEGLVKAINFYKGKI